MCCYEAAIKMVVNFLQRYSRILHRPGNSSSCMQHRELRWGAITVIVALSAAVRNIFREVGKTSPGKLSNMSVSVWAYHAWTMLYWIIFVLSNLTSAKPLSFLPPPFFGLIIQQGWKVKEIIGRGKQRPRGTQKIIMHFGTIRGVNWLLLLRRGKSSSSGDFLFPQCFDKGISHVMRNITIKTMIIFHNTSECVRV